MWFNFALQMFVLILLLFSFLECWYWDVLLIDMTTRPCRQWWSGNVTGWIASPAASRCLSPGCHGCTSRLYFRSKKPVQLRFYAFQLYFGEYLEIRRGVTAAAPLIGRYTANHSPDRVVEVAGGKVFILFNSSAVHRVNVAFNFTFQPRGLCLSSLSAVDWIWSNTSSRHGLILKYILS